MLLVLTTVGLMFEFVFAPVLFFRLLNNLIGLRKLFADYNNTDTSMNRSKTHLDSNRKLASHVNSRNCPYKTYMSCIRSGLRIGRASCSKTETHSFRSSSFSNKTKFDVSLVYYKVDRFLHNLLFKWLKFKLI